MVRLTKIYTRGGDGGETSLTGGSRVPKSHLRIRAVGDIDEANSAIGLANLTADAAHSEILLRIQNDLFDLGADISTPTTGGEGGTALRILPSQVEGLERDIDNINADLEPLNSFVLPGGSETAARLHLARSIVRRAERSVSRLSREEAVNEAAMAYLNRLSDLLFVMARDANNQGQDDVLWVPGGNRGEIGSDT